VSESAPHSEGLRKLVHVSMSGFALLLRWIPWWTGTLLALAALLFNVLVLPRLAGDTLMRPAERGRTLRSGVAFYALSVLILILLFRHHLEVAACAWGILALGDGASTLAGQGVGGPRLPWNPGKSWAGSLAFFLAGTLGGAGLMLWVAARYPNPPTVPAAFILAGAAALAGALVESLPLEMDDNLSVPILSGGLVYSLQRVDPALWTAGPRSLLREFLVGLAVTCLFALAAKWTGSVSWSGVAGGMVVGTVIATFAGMSGFTVLALFFVLGSGATRLGYSRKARRGAAQEKQGARGMVHAMANCTVPAFLAFLSASTKPPLAGMLTLAFVASLATAACDTLGSEVGPLGRGNPYLITRLARVPAGTPGAVSLLGTAAGILGALLLAAAAALLGMIPVGSVPLVALSAIVGTLLESLLGATLEPAGLVGSETINFINTAAGGLTALALAHGWAGSPA
jgi:uncharacterized protein (TIGR00297 family)